MSSSQNWKQKFAVALAGIGWSFKHESSFWVHVPIAVAVIGVASWLRLEAWRWGIVVVAVTMVVALELINTAIEELAAGLHPERDDQIGRALDISSGAVLVATIGAVILGLIAIGPPLLETIVGGR